ncbi:hypothetical protein [Corynebacterium occultum]|uniref:hypothetical protein n=1 Tax=Corynebacterium occultum TaxID=2675219 RepID=UPI0012E0F0A8|nr:hypothetical protein [Corynebacterium occultum]
MFIIILCCVVLVGWLKFYGLLLAIPVLLVTVLVARARPDATEARALRSSVELSAEDIQNVILEFENFRGAPDTDAMADRTLHRPALLDEDCDHPDLENFRFQFNSNRRFLSRLPARLAADLTVTELEQLLHVTDQRAESLKDAWLTARRSAKQLGPDY